MTATIRTKPLSQNLLKTIFTKKWEKKEGITLFSFMGLRLIYAFKFCHCHSLSHKVENTVPPPGIAPMANPLSWEAVKTVWKQLPCWWGAVSHPRYWCKLQGKQALSFLSLQLSLFKPVALQVCIYFISDGSCNKVSNSEIIHFYSENIQEKACEKWGWRFSTNTLPMQKKHPWLTTWG